jgi:adenine/guanine phosphoribosyltransferase-like PRPP-binding protein/anti-sigma regulatory factor (Ser/Thr protein kinase)
MGRGPIMKKGWSKQALDEGLKFDLSKVHFADFGSLADILLLLDRAVTDQVRCCVVLPSGQPTPGEQAHARALRAAGSPNAESYLRFLDVESRKRANARDFMQHTGFVDALSPAHWPTGIVTITDTVESSGRDSDTGHVDLHTDVPERKGYTLGNIFPFTWMAPLGAEELRESKLFLAVVIGLRAQVGLSAIDARVLSYTALSELVENVAVHAGRELGTSGPRALIGAVLLSAAAYRMRRDDQHERLKDFAERVGRSRSSVLRLVVGDSGIGIAARLGAAKHDRRKTSGVSIDGVDLSDDEDTAFYAFDRWSTSGTTDAGYERGTRGLARVERLVRSYRGNIGVRTTGAHIARLLLDPGPGRAIVMRDRYRAPGTLLEITVLPDLIEDLDADAASFSPAVAGSASALTTVRLHTSHSAGLSKGDTVELDAATSTAASSDNLLGVVATASVRTGDQHLPHRQLLELIDTVARISTPAALAALVLPDVGHRQLDLALQDLALIVAQDTARPIWDAVHEPILVLDGRGRWNWCGANRPVLALYDLLSRCDTPVPLAEAEAAYVDAGGAATDLVALRRDQHKLLVNNADGMALRIKPGDVVKSLHTSSRQTLSRTIEDAPPGGGVRRGAFRTPTLRVTSRWINVSKLIADTIGVTSCTFSLARSVERRIKSTAGRNWAIARVTGTPHELAREFSENLGLDGEFYEMPGELDLDTPTHGERIPEGSRVIVIDDLIGTENTARRALAHIIGQGAVPIAYVGVIDSRPTPSDITILNRTIPVISLVHADINKPRAGDPILDIDPILWQPVDDRPLPAVGELAPAVFLGWCENVDQSLQIGHVEGRSGRHFSVVPRMDRLFDDQRVSVEMLAGVDEAVHLRPGPTRIWHPGPGDSYAAKVARLLASHLEDRHIEVTDIQGIPRARAGGQWVYPSTVDTVPPGEQVLVLDWGSVTATTLQQLVRLAAEAGAATIAGIAILGELPESDARWLKMFQHICATRLPATDTLALISPDFPQHPPELVSVPLSIRFVTTAAVEGFPSHSCPMCATRERYRKLADSSAKRLREHAREMYVLLKPIRRDDARRAGRDLLGWVVDREDAADYLRWRGLLDAALRDTATRRAVLDRLHEAENRDTPPYCRAALIRLLAAEGQWLKLPPLRFEEGRKQLQRLCTTALIRSSIGILPEQVRWQAVLVLASSVPADYIRLLPDLFNMVSDQPRVLDELLCQLELLLQRPVYDTAVDNATFARSIERIRETVFGSEERHRLHGTYAAIVQSLELRVRERETPRPTGVQDAWQRVLRDLVHRVVAHDLEATWSNLVGLINDLGLPTVQPTDGRRDIARRAFHQCTINLSEAVLAYLPVLSEPLRSAHYRDTLGPSNYERLLGLCERRSPSSLDWLAEAIDDLFDTQPVDRDQQWEGQRRRVLTRLAWWRQFFLAAHRDDGSGERAHFVEIMSDVPARIRRVVEEAFAGAVVEFVFDDESAAMEAFCPTALLREALAHTRSNAERHQLDPGAVVTYQVDVGSSPEDECRIIIRNTGSVESGSPGHGMQSLRAKLEPFEATMHGETTKTGPWTFELTITLPRWTGGSQ